MELKGGSMAPKESWMNKRKKQALNMRFVLRFLADLIGKALNV
jgi:hypothetical protein